MRSYNVRYFLLCNVVYKTTSLIHFCLLLPLWHRAYDLISFSPFPHLGLIIPTPPALLYNTVNRVLGMEQVLHKQNSKLWLLMAAKPLYNRLSFLRDFSPLISFHPTLPSMFPSNCVGNLSDPDTSLSCPVAPPFCHSLSDTKFCKWLLERFLTPLLFVPTRMKAKWVSISPTVTEGCVQMSYLLLGGEKHSIQSGVNSLSRCPTINRITMGKWLEKRKD